MEKRTIFFGGLGAVLGVLIALALFCEQPETPVQIVQIHVAPAGEALPTATNMTLIQDGRPIGSLMPGAKLWSRPDAAPDEQLQLLLEWNHDATFETLFRRVADDATPAARKASAALERQR